MLHSSPTEKLLEAHCILTRHNLVIYKAVHLIHGALLHPDEELGMGVYYCLRMPAYRDELRRVLEPGV